MMILFFGRGEGGFVGYGVFECLAVWFSMKVMRG